MSSDKNQSFWISFLSNSEPIIQIFPLVCMVFIYTALLMGNLFHKTLDSLLLLLLLLLVVVVVVVVVLLLLPLLLF
jgi:hypothetical protein